MREQWMTAKDVAEYLKLSSDLIYKLVQQGKIPVSKVGSRWRFKKEKIDQWMEDQEPSTPQGTQPR
jgi:PTS system nitrogen regulatory IIA component